MKRRLLIIAICLLLGAAGAMLSTITAWASQLLAKIQAVDDLKEFTGQHSIDIIIQQAPLSNEKNDGFITGREVTQRQVKAYAPVLLAELSLYPPHFIERTKLRRIILCSDLAFRGQPRTAMIHYGAGALYFDITSFAYNERHRRKLIHHELFHIVDYRDDRVVFDDPDWRALNPESFEYGPGGANFQIPGAVNLSDNIPGFLNRFSTAGVEEDKAEVFAAMIVDYEYVNQRAKRDPIIRSKVKAIEGLLVAFSPEMDSEFWKSIRDRPRWVRFILEMLAYGAALWVVFSAVRVPWAVFFADVRRGRAAKEA